MLTPPDELADDVLTEALVRHWGVVTAKIGYRAVGFGSHHWSVAAVDGRRWFLTADELGSKRRSATESQADALVRLRAAVQTACDLRKAGMSFVVAPTVTREGSPVVVVHRSFAAALYEHVDGKSFSWGEAQPPAMRQALLDRIVALHAAPRGAAPHAIEEDFGVPHRGDLESAVFGGAGAPGSAPYAARTLELIGTHAGRIRRLLETYDGLVAEYRLRPSETVVTHGEPHPGNTMLTRAGLVLVDWETALAAPRERDLWMLAVEDPSIVEAYAGAAGVAPVRSTLELYRTQWDVADLAAFVRQLSTSDTDSADARQAWEELCTLLGRLPC